MVRNKVAPQQLNREQQQAANWNLLDAAPGNAAAVTLPAANQQHPPHPTHPPDEITLDDSDDDNDMVDLINDFESTDDSDDADFVLPGPRRQNNPNNRVNRRRQVVFDDEDDVEVDNDDDVEMFRQPYRAPRPRPKKQKTLVGIQDYGAFEKVIKESLFYVKVQNDTPSKDVLCKCGEVSFVLLDEFSITEFLLYPTSEFWIYVCAEQGKSAVYVEWNSELQNGGESSSPKKKKKPTKANTFHHYMIKDYLDLDLWQGINIQRYFELVLKDVNESTKEMTICIFFKKSALTEVKFASESVSRPTQVANVISYFFGISTPVNSGEKKMNHDTKILYKAIREYHQNKVYCDLEVQHPSLIPQLRPYQKAAVRWMISKEGCGKDIKEAPSSLHCLYSEIVTPDGMKMYYNRYGSFLIKDKPLTVRPSPGGILADEMGLGKTVEVLACMLSHPRENLQKPEYLEPIKARKYQRKKLQAINQDIYTLDHEDDNSPDESDNDSKDKVKSYINNDNENSKEISVHLPKVNSLKSGKRSRKKRKASTKKMIYSDEDDDCVEFESEDEDYKPGNSDIEDDYVGSRHKKQVQNGGTRKRSCRKQKSVSYSAFDEILDDDDYEDEVKSKSAKKPRYDPENEIANNINLQTIEKVILDKCWSGDIKVYKKEGSYKELRNFLKMKQKDPMYLMTLRERLNLSYNQAMQEYSAVGSLTKQRIQGFLETKVQQKSYFECLCGEAEAEMSDPKLRVQCTKCSLYQHAECVQYDVSNPYRGEYICPHCWTQQPPVSSRATLIVTPSSISYQWVDEIMKHLKKKAIRMFVYKGVASQGYLQPRYLADFDIVISTYESLSRELNYVDLPHSNSEQGRRFRHPKRFMARPSPLPCVQWWRVCLDEAQMVECTTSKTAEMALRLAAINRWCVTGTPVERTIDSLQGLLMFLGVDPYFMPVWWQRCLFEPYCHGNKEPLHNLLVQYMWRNSKKDVQNQIDIPDQLEEVHWLNFTPVETHFYKRLHTECSYDAHQRIKKFPDLSVKLSSLDRQTLGNLLQPLLKLRQACNHPQIVKGQFQSLKSSTMTMEQLLDNLIKKTKVETEEAHRLLVAAMNGLSAIHIMRDEWVEAVDMYRSVLQSVQEHSNIHTDSLQRLHTIHNLSELLDAKHSGIQPTLRDDNLKTEASEIRARYLRHYPLRVDETEAECTTNTKAIEELKAKYNDHQFDWWMEALQAFDKDFVREVRDELLSSYNRFEEHKCVLHPVETKLHLMQVLKAEMRTMKSQREDMIKGIKNLRINDPATLLDGAIDCHLRPTETNPPQCVLCATHELFTEYEKIIFAMKDIKHSRKTGVSMETVDDKDKQKTFDVTQRGNWGLSEIERILRYIQTKSLGKVNEEVYEDSQTHHKMLVVMKKEFKNYRIFWRSIVDYVSAMDEVNMATLRLRLRYPDEVIPEPKKKKKKNDPGLQITNEISAPTYIINPPDLPQQELKLKSDRIVAEGDLRIKLGQLRHLQNLTKTDFGKDGGSNPELCPICQGELGDKWAVMLCAHSYCMDCIQLLSNNQRFVIKCPMCRQPTKMKEISYVDTKAKVEEEEFVKIQGSLSTKMEGVVRVMLRIKAADSDAKVLIFSTWNDVLQVIADALTQNGILYRSLHDRQKFQEHLKAFKSKAEITALLMPITSGAKGLNLVEARHVILVEPLLNPAAELQALGRVHRIGQTSQTVVHRFLVRRTMEERMFEILNHQSKSSSTEQNTVTIDDLRKLFIKQEEICLENQIAEKNDSRTRDNTSDDQSEQGDADQSEPVAAIDQSEQVDDIANGETDKTVGSILQNIASESSSNECLNHAYSEVRTCNEATAGPSHEAQNYISSVSQDSSVDITSDSNERKIDDRELDEQDALEEFS